MIESLLLSVIYYYVSIIVVLGVSLFPCQSLAPRILPLVWVTFRCVKRESQTFLHFSVNGLRIIIKPALWNGQPSSSPPSQTEDASENFILFPDFSLLDGQCY